MTGHIETPVVTGSWSNNAELIALCESMLEEFGEDGDLAHQLEKMISSYLFKSELVEQLQADYRVLGERWIASEDRLRKAEELALAASECIDFLYRVLHKGERMREADKAKDRYKAALAAWMGAV